MIVYSDSVLSSYHDYLMAVDCDNVIDSVDIVMIWLHQQQLSLTLLTSHSINNAFCQTGHWCGYMIYHVVKPMIIYRMVIVEGRCDQLTSSSLHTYIIIG